MSFKHIFKPVKLRHKTLKNRIVFWAHTTNMAVQGMPGDHRLAYYRERAMGGCNDRGGTHAGPCRRRADAWQFCPFDG